MLKLQLAPNSPDKTQYSTTTKRRSTTNINYSQKLFRLNPPLSDGALI